MKYHLAVDSGGTKVLAILYDEAFRPLRVCRTGSTRRTSTPKQVIQHNVTKLIDTLELRGITISTLCGGCDTDLYQALCSVCTIERRLPFGELSAGLAAAECFADGYLALAGTGATIFCRHQGKEFAVGGFGSIISDEGSGYWIAREAFGAAIRSQEGWGKHTLLQTLIPEHLSESPKEFRQAIYTVYNKPDTSAVTCVADCAPLVTQAAEMGDAIALEILTRAGRLLALQLAALQKQNSLPKDLPVTISGSVWLGHEILFSEFRRVLDEKGMGSQIIAPTFQPIVGIILCHYFADHRTYTPADAARFRELYQNYLFHFTK